MYSLYYPPLCFFNYLNPTIPSPTSFFYLSCIVDPLSLSSLTTGRMKLLIGIATSFASLVFLVRNSLTLTMR